MSRHSEVFPPSVIALIRRAEYAGELARTLEFIAQEVIGR
jgi:type II secretory pathway component PulF